MHARREPSEQARGAQDSIRMSRRTLVVAVWAIVSAAGACSSGGTAADSGAIDAPQADASYARPVDAGVVDAPQVDALIVDGEVSLADAAPPDATPPPCACDTTVGCQAGCTCDPACGPLECAPFLPSLSFFTNSGGSVSGISMANAIDAWAVGSYGTIFRIKGQVIETVQSPTVNELGDVEVVDPDTGWAVGDGVILRLENGVWTLWQAYTPPGTLVGLDLVDDQNGLAVGYDGLVSELRDGVWSTLDIGAHEYLMSVRLVDRDNGRVQGNNKLWELRDGMWTSEPQDPGNGIYIAGLVDRDNGWGLGQFNGAIWRLQDGTWTDSGHTIGATGHVHAFELIDINNGIAITEDGAVKSLENGTWTFKNCTGCTDVSDLDLFGSKGWAVGYTGVYGVKGPPFVPIDTTQFTWNKLEIPGGTPSGFVTVAVTDESVGWAAGEGGTIMRLTPTGWTTAPSLGTTNAFRGMALSDATHGWAVASGGKIARLNNTWSLLATSPTTAPLYSVANAPDGTAWAVGGAAGGAPGTILRYDGVNWTVHPFVPSQELHGIVLTDAENGWAVGGEALGHGGIILRLEAGVWSEVMTTPVAPLWAVTLDGAGDGWAVGGTLSLMPGDTSQPVMMRLSGGIWSQVPVAQSTMLHGVAVAPDGLGWAVGTGHVVLGVDGGNVKSCPNAMPWPEDLMDIAITPAGRGWIVGSKGLRARTP